MSQFYLGCYVVDSIQVDAQQWCLPDDITNDDFKETQNPQELIANPIDFDVLPLELQEGACAWGITFSIGDDDFEDTSIRDSMFYGFYIITHIPGGFEDSKLIDSSFYGFYIITDIPGGWGNTSLIDSSFYGFYIITHIPGGFINTKLLDSSFYGFYIASPFASGHFYTQSEEVC
jgi:hypothetical protein